MTVPFFKAQRSLALSTTYDSFALAYSLPLAVERHVSSNHAECTKNDVRVGKRDNVFGVLDPPRGLTDHAPTRNCSRRSLWITFKLRKCLIYSLTVLHSTVTRAVTYAHEISKCLYRTRVLSEGMDVWLECSTSCTHWQRSHTEP
jgi:hypothetical protein